LYSVIKNSVTLSEFAPIATALYGTYAPLGSVKNNEFPFSSIPPIINATPIGLAPAYWVYCWHWSAICFATVSTLTGSS